MQEKYLEDLGLTKSEISVYLTLLDMESTTTGPIIKTSGIASGKAYIVLNKLLLKGLVTYSIKSGTKYYRAKDPEMLLSHLKDKESSLKEKERNLREMLPALKAKYEKHREEHKTEIYEGVKGFKSFYDWVLKEMKRGDCIDIMGVPREVNEKFAGYLLEWNKERVKLGIKMRIIYNHDNKEFGKKEKK